MNDLSGSPHVVACVMWVAGIVCGVASMTAAAQTFDTYQSLLDFQAASSQLSLEDFSSFTPGAFPESLANDLGDFSVSWEDGAGSNGMAAYIAPNPFSAAEHAPFTTSQYLGWSEVSPYSSGSGTIGPTVTLIFDTAITAVGFDFLDSDFSDEYALSIDGTVVPGLFSGDGVGFFGVTSETAFTTLTFTSTVQGGVVEAFGVDNLRYGIANDAIANRVWISASDGDWEAGSNWSLGLPPSDTANVGFEGGTAATATLNADATIQSLTAFDSDMTIALGGQTLTVIADLLVGDAGQPTGRLTISGTPGSALLDMTSPGGALRVGWSTTAAGQADQLFVDGVEIDLDGSSSNSYVNVGASGNGRLEVVNGGKVTDATYIEVADGAATAGVVEVRGAGSAVTSLGRFTVGDGSGSVANSAYGELFVLDGGHVAADYLAAGTWFGTGATPAQGLITLGSTTADTSTAAANNLVLGGHLSASTGALVEGGEGDMVINAGGSATIAETVYIVDADDSLLIDGGFLTGGTLQHGGTLNIQNGGIATFDAVGVLQTLGTPGNDAQTTVDGGTLEFLNNSRLQIGTSGGADAVLTINNGGVVHSDGEVRLADDSNSNGTVNIDGAGSMFTTDGALYVGEGGNNGDMFLTNQAQVTVGGDLITASSAPPKASFVHIQSGSSMTINGTGVSSIGQAGLGTVWVDGGSLELTNSDRLSVGRNTGASGNLRILNGGTVELNDRLFIGDFPGANGSVTVEDAGSTLTIGGDLVLADASNAEGTLTIRNAGTLHLGGNVLLGFGGNGEATINLEGGIFNANNGNITRDAAAGGLFFTGGTLNNPGTVMLGTTFGQTGILNRDTAGTTVFTSSYRLNAGQLNVSAGQFESRATLRLGFGNSAGDDADLNISGSGQVDGWGEVAAGNSPGDFGQINISAGTLNANTQNLSSDPAIALGRRGGTGVVNQTGGTVNAYHGDLLLAAIPGYTNGSGTYYLAGGVLDLHGNGIRKGDGGGTAVFNFTGGTLTDVASINLGGTFTQAGGTLAPGASPGITAIVGDFNFTGGTLAMELGGTTAGTQHDQITVTGNFHAAGDLDVTLLNSYLPSGSNVFDLFDFASASGSFNNINLPSLGGQLIWDTTKLLTTGQLAVSGLDSDFHWANPAGGSWQTDTNWATNLKPATLSTSVFDLNQATAYTVTMTQDETVASFELRNDKVVLNPASARTLTIDGRAYIGDATGQVGELTIGENTTLSLTGDVLVGTQGGTGQLTVAGTIRNTLFDNDINVGAGGTLIMSESGVIETDWLYAVNAASMVFDTGTIKARHLSGPAGSPFTIGGDAAVNSPAILILDDEGPDTSLAGGTGIYIGRDGGRGEVTFLNGGSLGGGNITYIGDDTDVTGTRASGKLTIESSFVSSRSIVIGNDGADGMVVIRGSGARLNANTGNNLSITVGEDYNDNGTANTQRGIGSLEVLDGATVRFGQFTGIGNLEVGEVGGFGTVVVDGAGSEISLSGKMSIGRGLNQYFSSTLGGTVLTTFGEGEVFVTNGAKIISENSVLNSFERGLFISAQSTTSGGTSRLVVDGAGSLVHFHEAQLANGGGVYNIDNGQGGLSQQTFTSTAILDITNGGTVKLDERVQVAVNAANPAFTRGEITVATGGLLDLSVDFVPAPGNSPGPGHLFLGGQRAFISGGGVTGLAGGTGILNINAGGTAHIGHTLFLIDSADTAVNLNGGILRTAFFDNGGNLGRFNWTTGTLDLTHSSLTVGTGQTLGNTLNLTAGKHLRLGGALTIDATGSLTIAGGGSVTTVGDFDPTNASTFSLQDGTLDTAQVIGPINVGTGGTLRAHGVTGDLTVTNATVEATAPDRLLHIGGALAITGPTAALRLDLYDHGGVPGTDHEQVIVTGQATLDGALHLTFVDDFEPAESDTFTVLTAASISGNFTAVTGDRFDGYTPWVARVVGDTVVVQAATAGDADGDGEVGVSDLNILAGNWKQAGSDWSLADFNADDLIDEFDLAAMAANWSANQTGVGPTFAEAVAAVQFVPEPGSLAMLLGGGVLLIRRREVGRHQMI